MKITCLLEGQEDIGWTKTGKPSLEEEEEEETDCIDTAYKLPSLNQPSLHPVCQSGTDRRPEKAKLIRTDASHINPSHQKNVTRLPSRLLAFDA